MDGLDDGDDQLRQLNGAVLAHRPSIGTRAYESTRDIRDIGRENVRTLSYGSNITKASNDEDESLDGTLSPPPLSSPSVASSFGRRSNSALSPQTRDRSRSTLQDEDGDEAEAGPYPDEPTVTGRHKLAWRLTRLAQQLADGDDVDDVALSRQIEGMERSFGPPQTPAKPLRPETGPYMHTRSDQGSQFGPSPALPFSPARSSQMSASLVRNLELETDEDGDRPPPKKGMTARQVKKVVDEAVKLNDELATVVENLKARQEESDHIHGLLIERAERAAQRIIFLQSRISYLTSELQENDAELQHLRISLKAVEVQMPPHPDEELQRCISSFKDDYQELKKKRASRASLTSLASFDSSHVDGSPTR